MLYLYYTYTSLSLLSNYLYITTLNNLIVLLLLSYFCSPVTLRGPHRKRAHSSNVWVCALDAWVTWPDRGPEGSYTSNILYLYYTYTTLHSTFILCIHRWLLHGCFHFSVKSTETKFQWPLQCNSLRANSNDQKWQHSFLLTYVLLRCRPYPD